MCGTAGILLNSISLTKLTCKPAATAASRHSLCAIFLAMQRILLLFTIVFGLTASSQTELRRDTTTLDFGLFTIETPKSWTKIKERGTDSYVGRIAIDNKDTLDFDLGWYSNKLYETGDTIILHKSLINSIDTSAMNIAEILFVDDSSSNYLNPDKYRKNNYSWDTIDGRKAKIIYPRQSGIGTTGIYIDSLWVGGSDIDRFNLYGINLKPENEKKVLQAIRTLKFHKK